MCNRLIKGHFTSEEIDLVTGPKITLGNKKGTVAEFECNFFYWNFIEKLLQRPACEIKWYEKCNYDFDLET